MSRNHYLVRLKPGGVDRTQQFLETNKIGMGWSKTGDISELSRDEIKNKLEEEYRLTGMTRSSSLASLLTMKERIEPGDIVVTANGPSLSIGEVVSGYYYEEDAVQEDYAHQRTVKWHLKNLDRNFIPEPLRKALRGQKTTYQLKDVDNVLEDMMDPEFEPTLLTEEKPKKKRGRPTKSESEAKRIRLAEEAALRGDVPEMEGAGNGSGNVRFVSQRYLLRPGNDDSQTLWVTVSIPADTTMEEAERLATFVSSCYYAD